jgi:hypothetical protein
VNAGAEGNSLAPRPAAGPPPRVDGIVNSQGNVRWRTVQGMSEQAHSSPVSAHPAGPSMKTTTEASRTHWSHRVGPVYGEKDGRNCCIWTIFSAAFLSRSVHGPAANGHGTCDAGAGVACLMQSGEAPPPPQMS